MQAVVVAVFLVRVERLGLADQVAEVMAAHPVETTQEAMAHQIQVEVAEVVVTLALLAQEVQAAPVLSS